MSFVVVGLTIFVLIFYCVRVCANPIQVEIMNSDHLLRLKSSFADLSKMQTKWSQDLCYLKIACKEKKRVGMNEITPSWIGVNLCSRDIKLNLYKKLHVWHCIFFSKKKITAWISIKFRNNKVKRSEVYIFALFMKKEDKNNLNKKTTKLKKLRNM